jgi:two-component system, chemotaxis family, protein-glutamate methylesterase/glutaminase
MVLAPDISTGAGMPENAVAYDGPIDVIGNPQNLAAAIIRPCTLEIRV